MKYLSWLILRLLGWKIESKIPKEVLDRCVIIAAPHTSNWDIFLGLAVFYQYKLKARFTVKKEWFKFPFKSLMQYWGAIGINRSRENQSLTDVMAELFSTHKKLTLVVTAEATRSYCEKWKTGFYYIALKAKVPIALGYLDTQSKSFGIEKLLIPTGDLHKDMFEIMDYYRTKTGFKPQNFSVDKRFYPAYNSKDNH